MASVTVSESAAGSTASRAVSAGPFLSCAAICTASLSNSTLVDSFMGAPFVSMGVEGLPFSSHQGRPPTAEEREVTFVMRELGLDHVTAVRHVRQRVALVLQASQSRRPT